MSEPATDPIAALCDFVQNSIWDHKRHCDCSTCQMVAAARNSIWAKADARMVTVPRELLERCADICERLIRCHEIDCVVPIGSRLIAGQVHSDVAAALATGPEAA